jgi:dTDP-4-amino-4,6-dideoxygalactose transaminase
LGSGAYPIAEKVASEIVSLPMFPGLTEDQQGKVVDEIVKFTESTSLALAAAG